LVFENQKPAPGDLVLDHIGHFVPDLEAREGARRAGLLCDPGLAPHGERQPAGTSNQCVMLEEGYLEILAPTLDTPHAERVRKRMNAYPASIWSAMAPRRGSRTRPPRGARLRARSAREPQAQNRGGKEVGFKVVYVPPRRCRNAVRSFASTSRRTGMERPLPAP